MEIAKIVATGILTTVCVVILRESKKDMALLVGAAGGIIILLMILEQLKMVIDALNKLAITAGVSGELFAVILKIIAIGYITEFSANICEDCGTKSIADKIVLAGKVLILVISLPIITSILDIVMSIL